MEVSNKRYETAHQKIQEMDIELKETFHANSHLRKVLGKLKFEKVFFHFSQFLKK